MMPSSSTKQCIEKKILLSGAVQEYPCQLMHLHDRFGVLRYVLDREYFVSDIPLNVGDITYALYWIDRPYTLYTWRWERSDDALYYFNIADNISLTRDEFIWRDLAVDILIDTRKAVRVLDEHELPSDLSHELRKYIERSKSLVLGHYPEIIREAASLLKKLTS